MSGGGPGDIKRLAEVHTQRADLTDSKTETSSTLRPPAHERTNTNRSLNLQKKKDVKVKSSPLFI